MAKSSGSFVADVYLALLRDIQSAFPHMAEDLSRDRSTLMRCFESRGHGVFYVSLPKVGKILDQTLELGSLCKVEASGDRSLLFLGSKGNGDVRPRFMHGLWSLICNADGLLLEEIDYVALSFLRQVYYLAKKVKVPCPRDIVKSCYSDFVIKDQQMPRPRNAWRQHVSCLAGSEEGVFKVGGWESLKTLLPDDPKVLTFDDLLKRTPEGRELLEVDPTLGQRLTKVFALIATSLGRYNPLDWRCKHGPGAIAARPGKTWKYVWYSWPTHLEREFPIADFGVYSNSSWAASQSVLPDESLEEASRLIAVRKTFDKPRLIAAEPNSHQWCQQNMLDYLKTRIRQSWIYDFVALRRQGRNQELCRRASETRELATLDLSDASDSVSCDLVEVAFASNPTLLTRLIAVRTRYIKVPGLPHPYELNKFSTMGSAVTFPVQTLLFLGMALATVQKTGLMSPEVIRYWAGQVSVYGDDIIVPCTQWERVAQVLKALGFKVNTGKTYAKGFFRESCGLDSYKGVDVTPVYLSHPCVAGPGSAIGLSATANHFYKKWMLNVAETIRHTVKEKFNLPTVATDSGVAGFCSRIPPIEAPKFRWNVDLQRVEIRVLAATTLSEERIMTEDDQRILQYFTEEPDPHDEWEAGYTADTRIKLRPRWVAASDLYGNWLQG